MELIVNSFSRRRFCSLRVPGLSDKWLGGVMDRILDLQSRGRGFDSWSGHYQVVSTWY